MKINKIQVLTSFKSLSSTTSNKFWGALAIISSIEEKIKPNKTYTVESSKIMLFLDRLFNLNDNPNNDYHLSDIYVKFSLDWKNKLSSLTLTGIPNLKDASIFYNKFQQFDGEKVNSSILIANFLDECKISLNEISDLFSKSTESYLQTEEYSQQEFIAILEQDLKKKKNDNYHLSFESPFFIQSRPSELKRAPFIQTLYSGDRIKELMLLSDSNLEELYPADTIQTDSLDKNEVLHLLDFVTDLFDCHLQFDKNLIIRFIASLTTKPFVILTGLSGSGKTKLAQAFVKWICNSNSTYKGFGLFMPGEEINSQRVVYKVTKSDINSVTFEQVDTQTKVTLPYELIYEWIQVISDNNFDISTPTRSIRELVGNSTKYSTQLNSFESHLKAAAFELISREYNPDNTTSQYLIVPVGADWTNREPLLGYPNAINPKEYVKPDSGVLDLILQANNQPNYPHFLILDEMNLSHVERYFADFLSAIESKEEIPLYAKGSVENGVPSKLKVPSNLFIIGTVNIDETTNMFSPKVLDRANTIEFRVKQDEMKTFLDDMKYINMDALSGKGAGMAKSFLDMSANKSFDISDNEAINTALVRFFGELKKVGAEFGYRSASDIGRLINQLNVLDSTLTNNQKIDIAIMQKLLPKLHGSRRKLCPILETLGSFCISDNLKIVKDVFEKEDFDFKAPNILYPLSLEKIARMYKGALDNGFTSFAEA